MATTSKSTYNLYQKVFCCKCFDCLQEEVVLTTDIRRQTLQRMVKNFTIDIDVLSLVARKKLLRTPANLWSWSIFASISPYPKSSSTAAISTQRDLTIVIGPICSFTYNNNNPDPSTLQLFSISQWAQIKLSYGSYRESVQTQLLFRT